MAAWLALGMCLGQEPVKLLQLNKLSKTVNALPRIAHPNRAEVKINRAFNKFDVRARGIADYCKGLSEQGDEMFFERSIDITSQGPQFLSMEVNEETNCGGVHAYFQRFTLTYDLRNGEQVQWAHFLTHGTAKEVTVSPRDGVFDDLPGVRSLTLQKLYIAGWKNEGRCHIENVFDPTDETGENLTDFQLSPAPHESGLSVLPANLPSVDEECALPVILGKSAMEELGIPEDLQKRLASEQ